MRGIRPCPCPCAAGRSAASAATATAARTARRAFTAPPSIPTTPRVEVLKRAYSVVDKSFGRGYRPVIRIPRILYGYYRFVRPVTFAPPFHSPKEIAHEQERLVVTDRGSRVGSAGRGFADRAACRSGPGGYGRR